MYSTSEEMQKTAASLVVFGAEVFKRAKTIQHLELLKQLSNDLDEKRTSPNNPFLMEFIFEYLVDSVRIIIFFENYMKAELIANEICVFQINKSTQGFEDLAKEQKRRPITMREVHSISPFETNEKDKTVYHRAIKETTLGFSNLVGSKYRVFYRFDKEMLDFVTELNKKRNHLHLYDSIDFSLSRDVISKTENVNNFVDEMIQMVAPKVND